ncbi:MAG: DUF3429 domain-containing protein [Pseudomonadota bacterium]
MAAIPRSALILGLSGVLPFAWGALTVLSPALAQTTDSLIGDGFHGRALLTVYGLTILAFMSGTLWGFGTRSPNRTARLSYALSVLPALYGVVAVQFPARSACVALAIGFVILLALDARSQAIGEAPKWWLRLRVLLTALVVICLGIGGFA